MNTYTFGELCEATGKSVLYIRNLFRALNLPTPRHQRYPECFVRFLNKAVALRTLNVAQQEIADLFELEKKILKLLHFDSLSHSEIWYLEACLSNNKNPANCLMLTEFDLGFPLCDGTVQQNLNFGEIEPELFRGSEMGEDVRRVLDVYIRRRDDIVATMVKEAPILKDALIWAERLALLLTPRKEAYDNATA